jgi:putative ABC transport system substrate-binding protein
MVLMAVLASTMFGQRNGVEAGGLISYEPNLLYKRAAILADKILKGAKPADLPVEFPIRLISSSISKLRKALGLTVALLASADEFDESSEARLGRRLVDLRSQVGVNLTPEPAVATNGY